MRASRTRTSSTLGEKGCAILSHALFPLLQIKTYGRRHLPSGKTLAPRRPAVSHATPLHTPGTGARAGGAARGWVAAEPGHGALGAHVFSANLKYKGRFFGHFKAFTPTRPWRQWNHLCSCHKGNGSFPTLSCNTQCSSIRIVAADTLLFQPTG